MAWTDLVFAYKDLLTYQNMNKIQSNFTALAQGLAGSPKVLTDALNSTLDLSGKTITLPSTSVIAGMLANTLDLSAKTITLPSTSVTAGMLANTLDLSGKTITFPSFSTNTKIFIKLTSQTNIINSNTKIQFNTEVFDLLNEFDNSVNYRFVATNNGYYFITVQINDITYAGGVSLPYPTLKIYVNGGNYNNSYSQIAGLTHINMSILIYMTAGQYIEIYMNCGNVANTMAIANSYLNIIQIL